MVQNISRKKKILVEQQKIRTHPGLNQGPLDLQSNALPLSYIPIVLVWESLENFHDQQGVLFCIPVISDVPKKSPTYVFVALVAQW